MHATAYAGPDCAEYYSAVQNMLQQPRLDIIQSPDLPASKLSTFPLELLLSGTPWRADSLGDHPLAVWHALESRQLG